jgi:hypothetical protein
MLWPYVQRPVTREKYAAESMLHRHILAVIVNQMFVIFRALLPRNHEETLCNKCTSHLFLAHDQAITLQVLNVSQQGTLHSVDLHRDLGQLIR